MKAYREKYGYKKGDFPNTEKWFEKIVSLPLYSRMKMEDAYYVVEAVKDIINGFS